MRKSGPFLTWMMGPGSDQQVRTPQATFTGGLNANVSWTMLKDQLLN